MPSCVSCGGPLHSEGAICPQCGETRLETALKTRTAAAAARAASASGEFIPGAMLGDRYRIIAPLGKGGMGEVYRADDLTLGQQVALKFLPPALARDEEALRRFRNEVRVARQVSHANVCRVYDVGEVNGSLFLSMEYVDGEDLASLLRRIGRLPADKGLEIARKLCAGLAAAHDKGVLHRDLKPGNVMLDGSGHVLLTDFGLAGFTEHIGGADIRSGTPLYMAPEQLAGKEVTARSDIYALGLLFYELFTGKRPHESSSFQELLQQRSESTPVNPSSFVHDLDPAVETVILRCLEPDPGRRPQSALAVAAALPGGDPLAAALAAGDTPSPQMVAAAGEGAGMKPRAAAALFAALLAGIAVAAGMALRTSALERIQPEFPPEVMAQKAREIIAAAGYPERAADHAYAYVWDKSQAGYIDASEKPRPRWNQELAGGTASLLRFWYRQSPGALTGLEFHSDLLIPGVVTDMDPPPIYSGMTTVRLDGRGRLVFFEAIPPQRVEADAPAAAAPDWSPLFRAAGLDPASLKPVEPRWTWLAASDTRAAWTGVWPGTGRLLRVEAAAFRGRPVTFSMLGEWDHPERMLQTDVGDWKEGLRIGIYGGLLCAIVIASAWLARRNLAAGRADRRGAFRLAAFVFAIHMALWLTMSHLVLNSLLGMFLLALCTALFNAVIVWTVYLALESYVRRHWPRTLISWSRLLAGQWRDPVVGRDVLIGAALGVAWTLIGRVMDLLAGGAFDPAPTWTDEDLLLGLRATLGAWLARGPRNVRDGLLFFFLLFLLRVLLRSPWRGAAAFVVLLTLPMALGNSNMLLGAAAGVAIYGLAALVVLRYGLLALTAAFCFAGFVGPPITLHTGAWYFGNILLLYGSAGLLAAWAFHTAAGGRRFWSRELFG